MGEKSDEELNKDAMARSERFYVEHMLRVLKIDVSALKSINAKKIDDSEGLKIRFKEYEILFLRKINRQSTANPNIAGYWTHEYNIDFQLMLERLFSGGLLTFANIKYTLSKCTIAELKAFAKKYNIVSSSRAKKADIIQCIIAAVPEKEIEDRFYGRFFAVTRRGIESIKETFGEVYDYETKVLDENSCT